MEFFRLLIEFKNIMKNFTTIFPLLVLSFLLCNTSSYAAEDINDVIGEQNRVIQNQQQFEQDKQRKNELQNLEVERKDEAAEEAIEEESEEVKAAKQNVSKLHKLPLAKIQFFLRKRRGL